MLSAAHALTTCDKVIHSNYRKLAVSYISDEVGRDGLAIAVNGSLGNNDDVQSPPCSPLLQQVYKTLNAH